MSRVATILVILALMAVVALVPLKDDDGGDPGPDLGNVYAYRGNTLARFRLLVEGEDWTLSDPPRNPQGMLEAVHERTGLNFVLVPAAAFLMGSPQAEKGRWEDEGSLRRVKVQAFLLCRTECTQSAWEWCGGENEAEFDGADRPVETVSWEDCHAWCEKNGLRLPSEAEWEHACRARTRAPFSTGRTLSTNQANYNGNYPYGGAFKGEYRQETVPAGSLPANPWGLHEMHGNVSEWCEDWYGKYEDAPNDGTARTRSASYRVSRGGSWLDAARGCRSAVRVGTRPALGLDLGFRPAADLP